MRPLSLRLLQAINAVASWLPTDHPRLSKSDAGVALSPFLEALRHLRQLTTAKGSDKPSAQSVRRKFRSDLLKMRVGFPVREARDMNIPGAAGALKARLYRPSDDALPLLLVYFHGGGFVVGDLDTHDDACRLLCQESGMPVLAVDYRLAPEHPFPAAVEDAEAAVRWALDHAAGLGAQAVAVGGDSAGGNLAAVTAQTLAGEGVRLLAQLLIYPGTDRTTTRLSHALFGEGFFLSQGERELFYHHYLDGQPALEADPRVSPLLKVDPGVLAPALVVTAGFDMLRDEGEAYAAHLAATGTAVTQLRFDRLGHAFINLAGVHTESRLAATQIARHWRQLCHQSSFKGESP